jgi:hypothetical protein
MSMPQPKRNAPKIAPNPPARQRARRPTPAKAAAEHQEIETLLEQIQRKLDALHAQSRDVLQTLGPSRGA